VKKEATKTFKKAKRVKDSNFAKIKNMSIDEMAKWLCSNHTCFSCPVYDACNNIGASATGWKLYLESGEVKK